MSMNTPTFTTWINTFIAEKGIDVNAEIVVDGPSGPNHMTAETVFEAMKATGSHEQAQIKNTFVKIDFCNGDVMHFVRHMAQALAI